MAELVLGPILRHVDADAATIWVETDRPCEVTILGTSEPTFEVEGHHFALVAAKHLDPGESTGYEVELDGETVWPEPDDPYPAPCIKPVAKGEGVRFIFGSCRVSYPHEEPWVLHHTKHPEGQGIDALRALALRLIRDEERPPDCLLMLGDQIYADDLSPAMRKMTEQRTRAVGGAARPARRLRRVRARLPRGLERAADPLAALDGAGGDDLRRPRDPRAVEDLRGLAGDADRPGLVRAARRQRPDGLLGLPAPRQPLLRRARPLGAV